MSLLRDARETVASTVATASRTRVAIAAVLVAGGLLYADWVLQLVLPVDADPLTSFISELSVAGQPFAWLFRTADITGGVLLAAGAAAAWWVVRERTAVWAAVGVLGVAILLEAAAPLQTSMTFDAGAAPATGTGAWWARMTEPHGLASLADTLSYLVLLVVCTRALQRSGVDPVLGGLLALLGITAAALGFVESGQTALFLVIGHAFALGMVQRIEVSMAATWIAIAPALLLLRTRSRPA